MALSLSRIRYSKLAGVSIATNLSTVLLIRLLPRFFALTNGERDSRAVLFLWIPFGCSLACVAALIDNFLPASCGGTRAEERQPNLLFVRWFPAVVMSSAWMLYSLR